ncbi:hypothetical protein DL96DRAFT_1590787 [Flagelloscypha sp. PMI_526]|nr:hypothetical protein DL96DRAFT_1590787 [Flagelloscypha sp. PMI_526]
MFQMLLNPSLNLLILGGRPYERWSRCRVSPHLNQNESSALLAVAGTISGSLPSLELTTHLDGSSLSHFRQLHSLTVDIDFFMTPVAISSIASLPSLRTLHLKSPWAWEQKGSLPSPPYAQGGFPVLQFVNVTNTANLREAIPWCQLTSVTVDGRDEPDYTSTVQYQSIFSLLMKMTNARSLAPANLRQLRLWPCYYSRNSKIRLDPTDNILLFKHLTTLDIVFLGAGWGLDFKDDDILRIVTALTALEHLTLQSPMINQPFVTEHNDAPHMPTPRALIYIAEHCLSIRSVDLFMTFTSQFPTVTSSNHSLEEIAFGRSSIPSVTSAASFLHALFPTLKIFNVTALDNPDIHSASHPGAAIEALELKNALENAQGMARVCDAEWALKEEE